MLLLIIIIGYNICVWFFRTKNYYNIKIVIKNETVNIKACKMILYTDFYNMLLYNEMCKTTI